MDLGAGPTRRPCCLRRRFWPASPSSCSTTAKCNGISYVADIVEGVLRVLSQPPTASGHGGDAPYAIYNIGNHEAVPLETFIATLERLLGYTAVRDYRPLQAGDVVATYAAIDRLQAATGFAPHTPLDVGLTRFVEWYRGFYC